MVQPNSFAAQVTPTNWNILEILAEQAATNPEHYVEDGLLLALWSTRTVLKNRRESKHDTGLLIVADRRIVKGYDLDAILRGQVQEVPELTEFLDPFANDERVPLPISPALQTPIEDTCVELSTSLNSFVRAAVDIKRILQVAQSEGHCALLETASPSTYLELPMTLAA